MTITPNQRLQAMGLLYLAIEQYKAHNKTRIALMDLLSEDYESTDYCDTAIVMEEYDVDALLKNLNIEIADELRTDRSKRIEELLTRAVEKIDLSMDDEEFASECKRALLNPST